MRVAIILPTDNLTWHNMKDMELVGTYEMNNNQNYHVPSLNTRTLTSHDIDQLSDVIKGASFEIQQLDNGNFYTDLFSSSLRKGILDKGYYNRSTLTKATFPKEYMTFGFIHNTPIEGRLNGEPMH